MQESSAVDGKSAEHDQFIHPENSSINTSNTVNSVMSFTKINHYEKEYADTHTSAP